MKTKDDPFWTMRSVNETEPPASQPVVSAVKRFAECFSVDTDGTLCFPLFAPSSNYLYQLYTYSIPEVPVSRSYFIKQLRQALPRYVPRFAISGLSCVTCRQLGSAIKTLERKRRGTRAGFTRNRTTHSKGSSSKQIKGKFDGSIRSQDENIKDQKESGKKSLVGLMSGDINSIGDVMGRENGKNIMIHTLPGIPDESSHISTGRTNEDMRNTKIDVKHLEPERGQNLLMTSQDTLSPSQIVISQDPLNSAEFIQNKNSTRATEQEGASIPSPGTDSAVEGKEKKQTEVEDDDLILGEDILLSPQHPEREVCVSTLKDYIRPATRGVYNTIIRHSESSRKFMEYTMNYKSRMLITVGAAFAFPSGVEMLSTYTKIPVLQVTPVYIILESDIYDCGEDTPEKDCNIEKRTDEFVARSDNMLKSSKNEDNKNENSGKSNKTGEFDKGVSGSLNNSENYKNIKHKRTKRKIFVYYQIKGKTRANPMDHVINALAKFGMNPKCWNVPKDLCIALDSSLTVLSSPTIASYICYCMGINSDIQKECCTVDVDDNTGQINITRSVSSSILDPNNTITIGHSERPISGGIENESMITDPSIQTDLSSLNNKQHNSFILSQLQVDNIIGEEKNQKVQNLPGMSPKNEEWNITLISTSYSHSKTIINDVQKVSVEAILSRQLWEPSELSNTVLESLKRNFEGDEVSIGTSTTTVLWTEKLQTLIGTFLSTFQVFPNCIKFGLEKIPINIDANNVNSNQSSEKLIDNVSINNPGVREIGTLVLTGDNEDISLLKEKDDEIIKNNADNMNKNDKNGGTLLEELSLEKEDNYRTKTVIKIGYCNSPEDINHMETSPYSHSVENINNSLETIFSTQNYLSDRVIDSISDRVHTSSGTQALSTLSIFAPSLTARTFWGNIEPTIGGLTSYDSLQERAILVFEEVEATGL